MTAEEIRAFGSLLPYWAFGLATAGSFYGAMLWIGGHFRPEFKAELTNWLSGNYESTWTAQFCRLFDTVFGPRHFSTKRILRSALASVLAVLVLYVLFAHVLGVFGSRIFGAVSLWQALLIGAAVNIIPDYVSLIETRWLLSRFERVQSVLGQIALLLADLAVTAAIIFAGIYAYSWFFMDGRIPSPVEILALFSVFAVFFYSTFLTSLWAWLYCFSAWFVRLFTRLGLGRMLDIQNNPVKQLALVGSALIVLGGLALGPVFKPAKGGFATAFDDFICRLDLRACFHAARAAGETGLVVHFMELACRNEIDDGNCAGRLEEYFSGDRQAINAIWQKACEGGYARGCRAHGYAYQYGFGVAPDAELAFSFYQDACEGNDMGGCANLGYMYQNGLGVDPDQVRAAELYRKACDGDDRLGCTNLGVLYEYGSGVGEPDPAYAVALYRRACEGNHASGCVNLAVMYEIGEGVDEPDPVRAAELYRQACEAGAMRGCSGLALMYRTGKGVEAADPARAVALYLQACEGGDMWGCYSLAWMYELGDGVGKDPARAAELHRRACEGGVDLACGRAG